jgi:hypothetical protein
MVSKLKIITYRNSENLYLNQPGPTGIIGMATIFLNKQSCYSGNDTVIDNIRKR